MTDTVIEQAAAKLAKARAELILSQTFYGVLVSQVEPVPSEKFPTMATNGKKHFYNPGFIVSLPQVEVLGVQAHETEHDARRHHTRRGWRDPKKWNIACDYAINPDLIKAGHKLPKDVLLDWKYEGWSAEDIYRARELDEKQQEQPQQPQAGDDESEGEQSQAGDDGDEDEAADNTQKGDSEAGEDAGEQDGDDEGDDAGGAGGEADDDDSGEQGKGSGDAGDPGEQDGEGEGNGEGAGEAEGDGTGEGSGEGSGDAEGEASGSGKPGQQSSGDPGGCGEVLDASDDVSEIADEDAKWERVTRQAAMLAAKRGDMPGHIKREIARNDHPPQDWRERLREFFDGGASTVETWNRPNRRFIGQGLILPGRQREGVNKVAMLVDTSGSVDDIALAAVSVEVQAALDENVIDELVVIYGDTRVTRVDTWRCGDEIEFDPKGGGGTRMRPLFKYVAEEVDDASLIVCFTDAEIEHDIGDDEPPACPLLWAYHGYPDRVRQYMENTPWGAEAIDVGSH